MGFPDCSIFRSWPADLPALIRIVLRDLGGDARRGGTQVLLIDDAILIDDESHDAGIAISCRIGDQRKATGHMPVGDIVHGAAVCVLALPRQDPEIVPV